MHASINRLQVICELQQLYLSTTFKEAFIRIPVTCQTANPTKSMGFDGLKKRIPIYNHLLHAILYVH